MSSVAYAETPLFNQPARWYIDKAELPWAILSLVIVLIYTASYWLDWSYLKLVFPLILICQVLTAAGLAYWSFVGQLGWAQTVVVASLVGMAGGLVSAVAALIRFWYPWLFFNLLAEPVWSGLLNPLVAIICLGFFRLPHWAGRVNQNTKSSIDQAD